VAQANYVQRTAAAPEAAESVGLTPGSDVEPEEKGGNEKADIEELTRRVYLDIKRRLAREWERARGRE
jgi:hypothetical protein